MDSSSALVSFKSRLKKAVLDSPSARRASMTLGDEYAIALRRLEDGKQVFKDYLVELAAAKKLLPLLQERDSRGWTVFHHACVTARLECAFALIEAGADVHGRTLDGTTGLHYLAKLREADRQPISVYNQLLRVVITRGAQVNAVKDNGETPLHVACLAGNDVCVSFLLSAGADTSLVTKDNKCAPLHFALFSENVRVIRQLIAAGARLQSAMHCDRVVEGR